MNIYCLILAAVMAFGLFALCIVIVATAAYLEARDMRKRDYHDLEKK